MRILTSALILLAGASLASAAANPAEALKPEAVNQRIIQHRTAETVLTITGPDGTPLADTDVVIRQTRHKFLFGSNAFRINTADEGEVQKAYQQRFAELLNFGTLGFYWGSFERAQGQPATERLKMQAEWCIGNGILPKGHPLCWHQVAPKWLAGKSPDEMLALQLARITRDVMAFKGLVSTWDVVNEAVVMPNYKGETTPFPAVAQKVGAVPLIAQCFEKARAANPQAMLLLNDYDTSPRFEKLIDECLKAGVGIDVIGIQSHMHQGYWGPFVAWNTCERFAKFGKPIHFTELTIISGDRKPDQRWHGARYDDWLSTPEGEARQAQQVTEFYTILFSHPAVHAITWWDFADRDAWLGAPAGLLDKDMKPKPAYEALMKLIKDQWWTKEVRAKTDAKGQVTFRGFLGDYAIQTQAGKGTFRIDKAGREEAAAVVK